MVLKRFLESSDIGYFPGTTNQENPFQGMSFVSTPCGAVGPPFMATLNLPRLTIRLPVWLLSNLVIPNAYFVSDPSPLPHEHQPHVNSSPSLSNVESTSLSSSSPVEKSDVSKWAGKKKMKRKAKKKNTKQKVIAPTSDLHVGSPLIIMLGVLMYLFPARINLICLNTSKFSLR